MNSLQAFIVLGLIFLLLPNLVPVLNVASNINDGVGLQGFSGFFFGNLGFFYIFFFIAMIFWWMGGGT